MKKLPTSLVLDSSLRDALQQIQLSGLKIAVVIDGNRHLKGIITDGDIRRALLSGATLTDSINSFYNANPFKLDISVSREELIQYFIERELDQIPLIDKDGCFKSFAFRDHYLFGDIQNIDVVIMAGGMGVRLLPLTENCPKALLVVKDRPLIEHVILNYTKYGFKNFTVIVNHLGDMIVNYLGDGSRFNCNVAYVFEKEKLGTAGSLVRVAKQKLVSQPFYVINCDILSNVNFIKMLQFHQSQNTVATMAVRDFHVSNPFGVVNFLGSEIVDIKEKPTYSSFINAGIYILDPSIFKEYDENTYLDMPDVFKDLITNFARPRAYPLVDIEWVDVGSKVDLYNSQYLNLGSPEL